MRKILLTLSIILSSHLLFAQAETKPREEYCMVVYDYRMTSKMSQEIGLVKPTGQIEITRVEVGVSPYSEIIKLLNKLNAEGWVVTNSESMNFSKGGNTTGSSLCYLLKRPL